MDLYIPRRIALLAAHGSTIFFIEQLVWQAAADRNIAPGAQQGAAWFVLWLFAGAALAYASLLFRGRIADICEGLSASMLVAFVLFHFGDMSDIVR